MVPKKVEAGGGQMSPNGEPGNRDRSTLSSPLCDHPYKVTAVQRQASSPLSNPIDQLIRLHLQLPFGVSSTLNPINKTIENLPHLSLEDTQTTVQMIGSMIATKDFLSLFRCEMLTSYHVGILSFCFTTTIF